MVSVSSRIADVTERIIERSRQARCDYLELLASTKNQQRPRGNLSCGNLAHGFAACSSEDKERIRLMDSANLAVVTAYNDMLSAHQPYQDYPHKIKAYAREMGCTAQVAGGTPAMCDGVTQGQPGMELSLLSRDHIAQSTAIALSHQMFDGILCLGICDKIVPGLFIGAMRFGHLPIFFLPSGPMPSGISNKEKATVRQLFAEGKVDREELLAAESASYHSHGTCTFYGTANTNQLLLEAMGLQLPGGSFVGPDTELRDVLTKTAVHWMCKVSVDNRTAAGEIIDERSIVNAIVALLASGGSTNLSIHLIAMARAIGVIINWDDFNELSQQVPLLARVYPNGQADVNHFHAAGGTSYLFRQLIDGGLMHADAQTMWGGSFASFIQEPSLDKGKLVWREGAKDSLDKTVVTNLDEPFSDEGGLRLLNGNLGRSIIKISAVSEAHRVVEAPAIVINSQHTLNEKFTAGELNRDCIVVVRYQGPRANGMPELHKLTPILSVLQDKGFNIALVTDGRMSGASGKVPAAIHLTPEAAQGGVIAKIQDGDIIRLDANKGELNVQLSDEEIKRRPSSSPEEDSDMGVGRELFVHLREKISSPEEGATVFFRGDN